MTKFSWKTLGLAALVAGSAQVATMGGGAALTLPVPGVFTTAESGQWNGQVEQIAHKKKYVKYKHRRWHYNRYRHGHRYRARRAGYRHFYGGYWYANPWWTIQVQPPIPYVYSPHVRWCIEHYNSYNVNTDKFFGFDGRYHRCRSPFRP